MAPTRISARTLQQWLTAGGQGVMVVDVRDGDHFGGHVKGSVNIPSGRFRESLPELERLAAPASKIVFYCQMSQQRGPTCAGIYERTKPANKDVYVLTGGFSEWAPEFGNDPELTESFIPSLYA